MASQAEMEEAELQRAIAMSLEEAGLTPNTASSGEGRAALPPVPSFEGDIQKAIALSLEIAEKTTASQDISVAIGMGLESARRRGYSMSDPEDDLKRALELSLQSARAKGELDDEEMAMLEPLFSDIAMPPTPRVKPDEPENVPEYADQAALDDGMAKALISAAKKMKAEDKEAAPAIDAQLKKSVDTLTTRLVDLSTDDDYQNAPPETPGRAAIKRGGVAALAAKFGN